MCLYFSLYVHVEILGEMRLAPHHTWLKAAAPDYLLENTFIGGGV